MSGSGYLVAAYLAAGLLYGGYLLRLLVRERALRQDRMVARGERGGGGHGRAG